MGAAPAQAAQTAQWLIGALIALAAVAVSVIGVVIAYRFGKKGVDEKGRVEREKKIKEDAEERTETRIAIRQLGDKLDETNRNIVTAIAPVKEHGEKLQELDRRVYALECNNGRRPRGQNNKEE